jgi:hypothetical protein
MNTAPKFNADEIRAYAQTRQLTQLDADTAQMILEGRAIFPVESYSVRVRGLVAAIQNDRKKFLR